MLTQQQTPSAESATLTGVLREGELVEYESKPWRVGLVNFSRARLDPVRTPTSTPSTRTQERDYAGSVNIGPQSTLRRLSPEEAAHYKESDHIMANGTSAATSSATNGSAVVGAPIPSRKDRLKTAGARAQRRKSTGSTKTATKPRKAAAAREPKVADKPCKCGCGGKTGSNFIPGHDARFKGWLLAIERGKVKKEDVLKKVVRDAYTWKKKGAGEIPTTDYKGAKHTGYESTSEA